MFEFIKLFRNNSLSNVDDATAVLLQNASVATVYETIQDAAQDEPKDAVILRSGGSVGTLDVKQAITIFEKIESLLGKLPEWGIKLPQPVLKYGLPIMFIVITLGSFTPQVIAAKSMAEFFSNPELYTQLVLLFGSGAFAKLFYNMTEANRELKKTQIELEHNAPSSGSQPNLQIMQRQLQDLRDSNQLKQALLVSKDCSLGVRLNALRLSFDLIDRLTSSMTKREKVSIFVPFYVDLLKMPGMKEDQLRDLILDKLSAIDLINHMEIKSACGVIELPEISVSTISTTGTGESVTKKRLELRSYLHKPSEISDAEAAVGEVLRKALPS